MKLNAQYKTVKDLDSFRNMYAPAERGQQILDLPIHDQRHASWRHLLAELRR